MGEIKSIANELRKLSYRATAENIHITIPCQLAGILDELTENEGFGIEEFPLEETDYKLSAALDAIRLTLENHTPPQNGITGPAIPPSMGK